MRLPPVETTGPNGTLSKVLNRRSAPSSADRVGAEAAAERRRIGEELCRGVRAAEQAPVQIVGVEVKEGLGTTGRDRTELDERLVEESGVRRTHSLEGGAGHAIATAVAVDVEAEKGPQGTEGGRRASVDVQTAASPEAGGIEVAAIGLIIKVFRPDAATDPQAGVRAWDVEKAGAIRRANTDILDRCALA
jgi:hypothetical protein